MWSLRILLTLLVIASVRAKENDECVDLDSRCADLASIGECVRNAKHMKKHCPVSCEVCVPDEEEDEEEEEEHEESDREEGDNEDKVDEDDDDDDDDDDDESLDEEDDELDNVGKADEDDEEEEQQNLPSAVFWSSGADLGKAQRILHKDAARPEDMSWMIAKARNYMTEVVPDKFGPKMSKKCKNHHHLCAYWAWKGECDTNSEYMKTNCAPMCQSCHYLTSEGH